jgi:hypothetical protein
MAKKRVSYRTRVKRVYSRARAGAGGKTKNLLDGVLGGAAGEICMTFAGDYGQAAGVGLVGWFRNNPTLLTIAGLNVGDNLARMIPGIGTSANTGGGYA